MELGLSVAALIVAVIAAGAQVVQGRRQGSLQVRMAALEEERRADEIAQRQSAAVSAAFDSYLSSSAKRNHKLVISNAGPADATSVHFELVGDGPILHDLPDLIPLVQVGRDYEVMCIVHGGTPTNVKALLTWDDPTGPQARELMLSLL